MTDRLWVSAALARLVRGLEGEGMPGIGLEGGLIRPVVAHAVQEARGWRADAAFWQGAAAIQYAHEASLVHDDILDDAGHRRGERTCNAALGVKAALVRGDHLLTASYRLAAATGSPEFCRLFSRAVERTVAGEVAQARSRGKGLSLAEYREIVAGKSGELFGCALAVGSAIRGEPDTDRLFEAGRRIGVCYQMLDDLIDYCPGNGSGKPTLQDHGHGHWTWPIEALGERALEVAEDEVVRWLHARTPDTDASPADRCLERFDAELAAARQELESIVGPVPAIVSLFDEWRAAGRAAVGTAARITLHGGGSPDLSGWDASLSRHGRSFSFAALWFPRRERRRVADVYAFCRFTDDLVDRAGDSTPAELSDRLDAWIGLCRRAWGGEDGTPPSLRRVMQDAARSGVPFRVIEDLAAGMRMDLGAVRYRSLDDLKNYTHRVAGVVGEWLTRLFGVAAPSVLERAALLGHAMQLTNILRDVGEDLDRGRVYLPGDQLTAHGITETDLHVMRRTGAVSAAYAELVESLMREADASYAEALTAVPALPAFFRRPVVIAARVYQGIHDEIRRNGYDNFRRRAGTSRLRKLTLMVRGFRDLRGAGTATMANVVRTSRGALARDAARGVST